MSQTNNTRGKSLAAIVGTVAAAALYVITPKFENEKLVTYRDVGGVLSYCDGATENAEWGRTYTKAECQAQLDKDLAKHAEGMMKCIKVELTTGQKIAFTDFTYNLGVGTFCKSSIAAKANANDLPGSCNALLAYDGVNMIDKGPDGRPVLDANGNAKKVHVRFNGLYKRRVAERDICLKRDEP